MRLTRKKATDLCIELWTWIAKTGRCKQAWPEWDKYGHVQCHCWFCEYAEQRLARNKTDASRCKYCPLDRPGPGEGCFTFAYGDWRHARTTDDRKKCAKLFLKQIKAL